MSKTGVFGFLSAIALVAGLVGAAAAADENGHFAIEGAGSAKCEAYLAAASEESTDFYLFIGWMQGYLTGLNRLTEDTYDLTPWQSTELLASALGRHCEKHPEEPILAAIERMAHALGPDRLKTRSRLVSIENGDKAVVIYEAVLAMVRARLKDAGYEVAEGATFDESLRKAIEKYQERAGLKVTGLPDQITVQSLLAGRSDPSER